MTTEEQKNHKSTIPVRIDSVKQIGEFQRTRCIYYRVEFDDMLLQGPFSLSMQDTNLRIEFANWNWAVLSGSMNDFDEKNLFDSSQAINQIFQTIEEFDEIFLDLGHIWLPNDMPALVSQNNKICIGDVYRLSARVFYRCYLLASERIKENEWYEYCMSHPEDLWLSEQETTAFRNWRNEEIEKTKTRYRSKDYANLRLPKKGAKE